MLQSTQLVDVRASSGSVRHLAPLCVAPQSPPASGIMTLLSMSVMLLMLVGEMKFAMESVPGQRGSFSDVPLLGTASTEPAASRLQ